MGLFKKKVSRDELIKQGIAESEAAGAEDDKKENEVSTGNDKIDIEFTKIHAQLDSFGELRKANSERFSRISEQVGELRGMIIDTNKAMSKVEVAATKSVDLVESVHPEKLMIEVRKQDGKLAALRAMIESNESIMKDMMGELKRMRSQMNFYKGTEQVLKMNEEIKHELADIKKMEAVVERHADKVETIFLEVEKKFSSFEKYDSEVRALKEGFRKIETDFEKLKASMLQKEDKKEFVDLLDKFNDFEKHTTNLLKLLDDRSKSVKKELDMHFTALKKEVLETKDKKGNEEESPEPEPQPQEPTPAEPKPTEPVPAEETVTEGTSETPPEKVPETQQEKTSTNESSDNTPDEGKVVTLAPKEKSEKKGMFSRFKSKGRF